MENLLKYLPQFHRQKILVIGDVIADSFITGIPQRLSREAPVLILKHTGDELRPGGGSNAANNVAALGGDVDLVGVIGRDQLGSRFRKMLEDLGIHTDGLIMDRSRPTSVKTRILAGGGPMVKQQIVRIDHLKRDPIDQEVEEELLLTIKETLPSVDAVLVSDYGNGIFTTRVREEIQAMAIKHEKILAVDSRYQLTSFKGMTIATPNQEETEAALGLPLDSKEKIEEAGWRLRELMEAEAILITLGGDGMQIFTQEGSIHTPASNYTEVYDVTGAGDTVIAVLTLALASGASMVEAMHLANYAAGLVVKRTGVATASQEELRQLLKE